MLELPKLNTESPDFANVLLKGVQIQALQRGATRDTLELEKLKRENKRDEDVTNALQGYKVGGGVDQSALTEVMKADPRTGIALQTQERLLTHQERNDRITKTDFVLKLLPQVKDDNDWKALLSIYSDRFGDDGIKGHLPLNYDPEFVNRTAKLLTSEKERLEIDKLKNEGWSDPKEGKDKEGNPVLYQVHRDGKTRIVQDVSPKEERLSTDQLTANIWQKVFKDPKSLTPGEIGFLRTTIKTAGTEGKLSDKDKAQVEILQKQAEKEISMIDAYRSGNKDPMMGKVVTAEQASAATKRLKDINDKIRSFGTSSLPGSTGIGENALAPLMGGAPPTQGATPQPNALTPPSPGAGGPQPEAAVKPTRTAGAQLAQLMKQHTELMKAGKDPMEIPEVAKATKAYFDANGPEAERAFIEGMNAQEIGKKPTSEYRQATIAEIPADIFKKVDNIGKALNAGMGRDKVNKIVNAYAAEFNAGQPPSFQAFIDSVKKAGIAVNENALKPIWEFLKTTKTPYLIKKD